MSYRNKTYVIFDGDNDMWAYRFMRGWRESEYMDFDFHDAHDLRPLTDRASDETVRTRLRDRLGNTKQAIVLVGDQHGICTSSFDGRLRYASALPSPSWS